MNKFNTRLFAMGIVFFSSTAAYALPKGISGYSGNPANCTACHSGGTKPTVSFIGPASVAPGSTTTYTFRISGLGTMSAGLDISAVDGTLQNLLATTRLNSAEIVQNEPIAPVEGVVDVKFEVVAPASGIVKLYASGLSADGSGTGGDGTANATLDIPVVIANLAPVANAGGPYSALIAAAVDFDGSLSKDADGTIASYEWDFGDGAKGSGAKVSHAYAKEGIYTAILIVTDDQGATGEAKATVTIKAQNIAPVADAGGPYTPSARGRVVFNGKASTDADGSIVKYSWDFGDGTTGKRARMGHAYSAPGVYDVTLTVTDDSGATNTAAIKVTIP